MAGQAKRRKAELGDNYGKVNVSDGTLNDCVSGLMRVYCDTPYTMGHGISKEVLRKELSTPLSFPSEDSYSLGLIFDFATQRIGCGTMLLKPLLIEAVQIIIHANNHSRWFIDQQNGLFTRG